MSRSGIFINSSMTSNPNYVHHVSQYVQVPVDIYHYVGICYLTIPILTAVHQQINPGKSQLFCGS